MTTVRGKVTKREIRPAGTGAEVLMTVQPTEGPSIPVLWRAEAGLAVGDAIEASGEQDTDGYLVAASVHKLESPRPFPRWLLAIIGVIVIAGAITIWRIAGTTSRPPP